MSEKKKELRNVWYLFYLLSFVAVLCVVFIPSFNHPFITVVAVVVPFAIGSILHEHRRKDNNERNRRIERVVIFCLLVFIIIMLARNIAIDLGWIGY